MEITKAGVLESTNACITVQDVREATEVALS